MNRRSLFGALALSPLMVVEALAKEKPTGEPLPYAVNMTLMGTAKREKQNDLMYLSNGDFTLSGFNTKNDPTKAVSMAVGDDGNLWLKRKDGEWKRIVTE